MKVEHKGHTIHIKDTQLDIPHLIHCIESDLIQFGQHNLIVDLSRHTQITTKDLQAFLPLIKLVKKNKKSFIFVAPSADFNAIPTSIVAVPSLLEAHDLIEMDEIERDLGF
ncbi:MAG: ribonuclease Z [Flavobacterium sp. BFFFF2]|nr:MAG: ribonuclease Z [Flavobacterium sp. BFFFF2]